jgi:hypothetical protein
MEFAPFQTGNRSRRAQLAKVSPPVFPSELVLVVLVEAPLLRHESLEMLFHVAVPQGSCADLATFSRKAKKWCQVILQRQATQFRQVRLRQLCRPRLLLRLWWLQSS